MVIRYLQRASLAFVLCLVVLPAFAQTPEPAKAVIGSNGMVVAQEARAAEIGRDILKAGGNAVDAAVATGFALAVTYPRAGNLGGGGFMVIHLAEGNRNIAIDYREIAPAASTRDMFLDENGEADPQKSRSSGLAIGVPGTVAGLALAHRKYGSGKFTLAQLIAPSIPLARDGFILDADIAAALDNGRRLFARWPSSAKIFLNGDGNPPKEGERLIQSDLADSLSAIAQKGPDAFYREPIAEKIAAAVREAGGIMTADDLKTYRAVERTPVRGTYRGYEIVSMPPPSSGGVHLVEMLNILEGYKLGAMAPQSPQRLHLLIAAMKRAYADRAVYLGDPDFIDVPVKKLTAKDYAAQWRKTIDPEHATPAKDIGAGGTIVREGDNTTHFSVADRFGNAVSNTYTLNLRFGVGLVAEGTGILLNNELDDFAAKPGAPNAFGLVGGEANAPGPRKRPLSSMTPTIVLKNGKPYLVTGSPGGSRIITATLQVILNVIDHKMNIAEAVTAPRIHHQWLPDRVFVEPGLPDATIEVLKAKGHAIEERPPVTAANSILVTHEGFAGAADTRTQRALAVGY